VTDQFGVRPADVTAHAGHVEAIADRVATAAAAGTAVRPGPAAYGQLCTMVPVMLGALQDILVAAIGEASASLHDTGGRLRTVAQSYETVDENRAQVTDRIRDAL
jgi:hypothetical protein